MRWPGNMNEGWLKVDLHLHSGEDPLDAIDYSAAELVERAIELGFGALSITLHSKVFHDPALIEYAAQRGLLLIPGVELRLEKADCVLLNIMPEDIVGLQTFADLRALRARKGNHVLTIAPHPYYILGGSIGSKLRDLMDCMDAIEFCHFHTRLLNPNAPAVRIAKEFSKPMLATSDAHRLSKFGKHFSYVESNRDVGSLFAAIRANRIRLESPPAGARDFLEMLRYIFIEHPVRCLLKR